MQCWFADVQDPRIIASLQLPPGFQRQAWEGKPGHIVPQRCATWSPNGTTPSEVVEVKVVGDSRMVQQKQQHAVGQEKPVHSLRKQQGTDTGLHITF